MNRKASILDNRIRNSKAMITDNDSALKVQDFSCTYQKPMLQELAVPSSVVCGGSNYDLGDKRNFEGEEEETEE